ncbi:hypothetical protein EIP86_000527 [Pleurotus ostreatoroseus]|nr:hypothetical protein EIP86_000527 [Pleurotus ostreatoroseus]
MAAESSSLETFESTLKEAVAAKRLSASSMKEVTTLALKNMQNDTQLVCILYRTHKTLNPARKVHSLYVFDALARAAKHQVDKQGLTADLNSGQGNCATFLLKVVGILDGLIQDMVATGSETKDKAKKILDIWTKSNTFPSAVLSRLHKLVKGSTEKGAYRIHMCSLNSDKTTNEPASTATVDPRPQSHNQLAATQPPPPQVTPPAAPVANDMQATLLALLSQAANAVAASSGQTTANIPATVPTSQPATTEPFTLLQQLKQAANAGNIPSTQPIPVPVSLVPSSAPPNAVPPVTAPVGGPSQPPPYYRDDRNGFPHKEPQYDRYGPGPDRGRDNFDDRRDQRGPPRGGYRTDHRGDFRGDHRGGFRGGFRGRGRGRRDDNDRRNDMHRDQDWGPPARHRSGRSRSPSHARYRREDNMRGNSPAQITPVFHMPDSSEPAQPAREEGKDEFGRDLRPPSQEREAEQPPHPDQESRQSSVQYEAHSLSSNTFDEGATPAPPPAPIPTVTDSTPPASVPVLSPTSPVGTRGLDSFDLSAFDLTAPASWEALANAWKVTHGYMPQQAELMQYIMAANVNKMNDGLIRSRDSLVKGKVGEIEAGVGEAEAVAVVVVVVVRNMGTEMGLGMEAIQTKELTP